MHVVATVVYKAQFPESVHEEADSRTGCAHHFCQGFLAQSGDRHFGHAFFAEMCHQEKHSRQALLAGIEKLIDQIILIADVSLQQVFSQTWPTT
jgi:hypothetical protein